MSVSEELALNHSAIFERISHIAVFFVTKFFAKIVYDNQNTKEKLIFFVIKAALCAGEGEGFDGRPRGSPLHFTFKEFVHGDAEHAGGGMEFVECTSEGVGVGAFDGIGLQAEGQVVDYGLEVEVGTGGHGKGEIDEDEMAD